MFNPLKGSELQRFMGEQQIHHFYGGFAKNQITSLKQLRELPLDQVIQICGEMKMPRAAIDRLLESTGIRKKTGSATAASSTTTTTKPAAAPKATKASATASAGPSEPKKRAEGETDQPAKKTEEKSKREASSYYHFASTPADQAAKFKPQKVDKPTDVKWKNAEGASAWNPGNTFEERDYTKIANGRWEEMMKDFKWPGSKLRVSAISNSNMDFSIVCVRGKVKYIYDMSFSLEFKGKMGDESVKGNVEMSDIMPDDDPDEWEWSVNMKKNNAAHRAAQSLVDEQKQLVVGNLKLLIAELQAKYSG